MEAKPAAKALAVPLLSEHESSAIIKALQSGREKPLRDAVRDAHDVIAGRGYHVMCMAFAFLACNLPSLRDRLSCTFALHALACQGPAIQSSGAQRASGPLPAPSVRPISATAWDALLSLISDARRHMIQRALAYKLLRDDGWAQAMGSLTSREVEDTVASLGTVAIPSDPHAALGSLWVSGMGLASGEDSLAAGKVTHVFGPPSQPHSTKGGAEKKGFATPGGGPGLRTDGPQDLGAPGTPAFGTLPWPLNAGASHAQEHPHSSGFLARGPLWGNAGAAPAAPPAVETTRTVSLTPCLARPRPPLLPVTARESLALLAECCERPPPLSVDPRLGTDWADLKALRSAMAKALDTTLLPKGQALLLEQLQGSPDLASQCGLTPAKIVALVENNPALAIEVLRLMTAEARDAGVPERMAPWIERLVEADISLHSMEVINCLAGEGALSRDQLRRFVSHCISQCERVDERRQNRLVRLVCVFLRTLIKARMLDVDGLFLEAQAFCILFARFKDAATLYRLLKASGSAATSPRESQAREGEG